MAAAAAFLCGYPFCGCKYDFQFLLRCKYQRNRCGGSNLYRQLWAAGINRRRGKFSDVIGILDQTDYRQSFQNLLPWAQTAVSGGDNSESANISLAWEDAERESCFLVVFKNGKMVVGRGEDNGFSIYYATDDTMLDKLVNYVQEYGIKMDE